MNDPDERRRPTKSRNHRRKWAFKPRLFRMAERAVLKHYKNRSYPPYIPARYLDRMGAELATAFSDLAVVLNRRDYHWQFSRKPWPDSLREDKLAALERGSARTINIRDAAVRLAGEALAVAQSAEQRLDSNRQARRDLLNGE